MDMVLTFNFLQGLPENVYMKALIIRPELARGAHQLWDDLLGLYKITPLRHRTLNNGFVDSILRICAGSVWGLEFHWTDCGAGVALSGLAA